MLNISLYRKEVLPPQQEIMLWILLYLLPLCCIQIALTQNKEEVLLHVHIGLWEAKHSMPWSIWAAFVPLSSHYNAERPPLLHGKGLPNADSWYLKTSGMKLIIFWIMAEHMVSQLTSFNCDKDTFDVMRQKVKSRQLPEIESRATTALPLS